MRIGLCVAGLAVLAFPVASSAAGVTYDCDTAANHYSELVLPGPSGAFAVTGSVKLNAIAESSTYTPLARMQIGSASAPGQAPNAFAGFSLIALPAKQAPSGAAVQMLSYNVNGKEDEALPFSVLTKPGTVQPFRLSYDGNNVSVTLGNESKTFPVKADELVVRIVCSTGEFLFTDVVIQPSK